MTSYLYFTNIYNHLSVNVKAANSSLPNDEIPVLTSNSSIEVSTSSIGFNGVNYECRGAEEGFLKSLQSPSPDAF